MAKSPEEMNEMVEQASDFLQVVSLRLARGSHDEIVRKPAEKQLETFLERFEGWSSQDLSNLREALLKKFDQEMQNAPQRINGNDNPERQKLNNAMRNVFQNLFDIESAVKREESDIARVEVVADAVAQNSEVKPVEPKPVEPKTFLQKIKEVVDKGVQKINEKAAEIRTNIETRAKEQKIEKAVKKFEGRDPLQIISSNAEKAINKIRGLGERASARIMGLLEKVRPGRASGQDIEMSAPDGFKHVAGHEKNNEAALAAKATLDTGHAAFESEVRKAEVKPEEIKEIHFGADEEVIPGLKQSELDDLLKDVKSSGNPVSQEELDVLLADNPQSQAEAVVEQLQQDVQATTQNFVEKAAALEDFSALDALAPEKGVSASELDISEKGSKPSKPQEKTFDQMMAELDSALGKIDNESSEKAATKAPDPGTPRSGNDSGSSTPRAGH